jgi:hypothetical protein
MTELSEIKNLLEVHRKESNDWRTSMGEAIVRIETHQEYTHDKLKEVDILKTAHNKQKGFLYALSILGLGGIEEFFRHLLK